MNEAWNTLPPDVREEVEGIALVYGDPLVRVVAVGTEALWEKRGTRAQVCMVVRRPGGVLLTFTKTFYPPGVYRLFTGGVEPGESVLEALKRETVEETGLEVAIRRFLALVAYRPEDADGPPRAFTFAFLLDELGGTLGATDPGERLAGYREIRWEELPAIADQLAALPDEWTEDFEETWRQWGQWRAAIHRVVWEALRDLNAPASQPG